MAEIAFDLTPHVLEAPLDAEGFVQSFTPTQLAEQRTFFLRFGFVVVRGVVPEPLRAGLEDTVLAHIANGCKGGVLDASHTPNGAVTATAQALEAVDWSAVYQSRYNESYGFLGNAPALEQAVFDVRQHPALVGIFQSLFGSRQVWCKFDRFGLMRPTTGLAAGGQLVDRPAWKTEVGFVHWDQNPWLEPDAARIQALIAITPHTATSGGFHCIPGVHSVFNAYAEAYKHKERRGCCVNLPNQDDKRFLQRITMRPGSMVLWDSRLPHGNWPNNDNTFRMVLYSTMYVPPPEPLHSEFASRLAALIAAVKPQLTPLGRQIFGLPPASPPKSVLQSALSWAGFGAAPEPAVSADIEQDELAGAVAAFNHSSLYNRDQNGLFLL